MVRQPDREVHERLVAWAEAAPPVPTPALARFMGPIRPLPTRSTQRPGRGAIRVGVGVKAFVVVSGLAISGAAAAGIAQVALRGPEPPSPLVVPVERSTSPMTHDSSRATPTTETSRHAAPAETAPSLVASSQSGHPTSGRYESVPGAGATTSDGASDGDMTPTTSPSTATSSTPMGGESSPEATDPSDQTTESPAASAQATSGT